MALNLLDVLNSLAIGIILVAAEPFPDLANLGAAPGVFLVNESAVGLFRLKRVLRNKCAYRR